MSLLSQLILGVRPVILRVNPNCAVFWRVLHVQAPTLRARVQAERTTLCDDCRTSQIWHRRSGTHYAVVGSRVGERTLIFSSPRFVMLKKTRKKSAQIKCIHVSRVRGDQGTCRGFNRFIIIFSKIHRFYWVNVGTFELK